jgi:hypothetical protein
MVQVFNVRIVKDEATPFLRKMIGPNGLSKALGKASYRTAKLGQRLLRKELHDQDLIGVNSPHLWQLVEARRLNKSRAGVFVPEYGLGLDHAAPHWVPLRVKSGKLRQSKMLNWAQNSPKSPFKHWSHMPQGIFVRPHPWIAEPLMVADSRSMEILQEELNKVTR